LAWTLIEAFCISRWGMTPGKWIYRVRVVHSDGRFLTYGEALTRALQVFTKGMAFGLPGVQLIAMALAMKELTETGATPWDRNRFVVQHAQPKPVHQAAVFVLILVFLIFSVPVFQRLSGG
ncbi:MAG: RDD family protein, partial [Planctomycetota bacterium]|nr:RDD family protein [Planctomycetota bacterium]